MEFDLENPLDNNSHALLQWDDDDVASLFLIESQHTPSNTYFHTLKAATFNISVRTQLISLISKFSCSLDPLVSYLSVNYLDRFLSNKGILKEEKAWALRLLAISCISLASKMIKSGYSAIDIQALLMKDGGMIFERQTMQRMEGVILGALEWRMRSITPFSFLTFFINLICVVKHPMEQVLKKRVAQILFNSQGEIKLLQFKPSIIAASALLYASHELFPFQFQTFSAAISNCSYVNKEMMVKCYNVIQEVVVGMEMEEEECVINEVSSSGTPVNVLDLDHNYSLTSDNNGGITILDDNDNHDNDDEEEASLQEKKDFIINKRRKINKKKKKEVL